MACVGAAQPLEHLLHRLVGSVRVRKPLGPAHARVAAAGSTWWVGVGVGRRAPRSRGGSSLSGKRPLHVLGPQAGAETDQFNNTL